MNVKLSFDSAAAERKGCTAEQMRQAVKDLFAAHDLPCVSEGDVLVFTDKGHGDDFACMWEITLALLRSRWFLDCASSFVWEDEDGEEDLLGQTGKEVAADFP